MKRVWCRLRAFDIFLLSKRSFFYRETISNQQTEGDTNFQKSTGALISDKDRELETLRNEVLTQLLFPSLLSRREGFKGFVRHCRLRCFEEKTPWPRPCRRPWRHWSETKLSCRAVSTVWSKGSWERRSQGEKTSKLHPQVRR